MKDRCCMWGGHRQLRSGHAIVLVSKDGGHIRNLHRLFFIWWNIVFVDEFYCVCGADAMDIAIGQTPNLIT